MGAGFCVVEAIDAMDVDVFRVICREYAASLPFSLDYQGFEEEMAGLPGKYAGPGGVLFLARDEGGEGLGSVAVRELPGAYGQVGGSARSLTLGVLPEGRGGVAELKRMYVRPAARGRGVGLALGAAAVGFARGAGYRAIWLDSEPEFAAALAVYRKLGFVDIPRYNEDPNPSTVYMGLELS